MHKKPEQTPLARAAHSSTTQPAIHTANPIKTQNINALHNQQPIPQIKAFNASYVPGYFTPGIEGQV
jgi:hypothetical protein